MTKTKTIQVEVPAGQRLGDVYGALILQAQANAKTFESQAERAEEEGRVKDSKSFAKSAQMFWEEVEFFNTKIKEAFKKEASE